MGDDRLLVRLTDRISPLELDPLEEEEMANCIELPFSSPPSPCLCLFTRDELPPEEPSPTPLDKGGDLRLSAILKKTLQSCECCFEEMKNEIEIWENAEETERATDFLGLRNIAI